MTMYTTSNQRSQIGRLMLTGSLVALALFTFSLPAQAAETKVTKFFNKLHSLRGDCITTTPPDNVADPGCPEVAHPPEGSLAEPGGVATDPYGDIYVVNHNQSLGPELEHIDIFDPGGHYIGGVERSKGFETERVLTHAIAVDSKGYLYVTYVGPNSGETAVLARYDPIAYRPAAGEITYASEPVVLPDEITSVFSTSLAVDPTTDHLFVAPGSEASGTGAGISEYGSAVEGVPNKQLTNEIAKATNRSISTLALDAARHRIYFIEFVPGAPGTSEPPTAVVKAIDSRPPYAELPQVFKGPFQATRLQLAVDETSGHLFVGDINLSAPRIYEYEPDGTKLGSLERPPNVVSQFSWMTIDNSEASPNHRYLYATSGLESTGNLFAFEPKPEATPPAITSLSFSGVTEDDAVLHASVNPRGSATHWALEYVDEETFDSEEGFAKARIAGEGDLPASSESVEVSAPASGLSPGTSYRYRVRAESDCEPGGCPVEKEGSFTTFKPDVQADGCSNQAFRIGSSAALPDCRAYELVTPADTAGLPPLQPNSGLDASPNFGTSAASPSGDSFAFMIMGGLIPGQDATGGSIPSGDLYAASRGPSGWHTAPKTPNGTQATFAKSGGLSSEHGYAALEITGIGTLVTEGESHTAYVRYPDDSLHLVGEGSLGVDPDVKTLYIAPGGSHILFRPPYIEDIPSVRLEPEAPLDPSTVPIYDRTSDGMVHVVSLLPGNITPGTGEDAFFSDASKDASVVAFRLGGLSGGSDGEKSPIYVRLGNAQTQEVPEATSGLSIECDSSSSVKGTTSYEWLLNGSPIGGATSSTYTPEQSQAGSLLQCVARVANAEGGALAAGEPLVIDGPHQDDPRPPAFLPSLPNSPAIGDTLECKAGSWGGGPSFTYQWYRNGIQISSGSSYEVQPADTHTQLQCGARAQAGGTEALAFTRPVEAAAPKPPVRTGVVTVENTSNPGKAPVSGNQLLCKEGTWLNAPTFSYQWLRNGAVIASANAAGYQVEAADEGTALQCEVLATTADGAAAAVSAAAAVAPASGASLPSGSNSVKGTLAVSESLQCDTGTWSNAPTFSYQWLRNGTPIASATSASYTLTPADRETVVQCRLAAANGTGTVIALGGGLVSGLGGGYVNAKPDPSVAPVVPTFAGLSDDGRYLFYMLGGHLLRYDTNTEQAEVITATGDVTPVNVAPEGTAAYFLSPSALPTGPNPRGAEPQPGAENLYYWNGSSIAFVATVTERDAEGRFHTTLGNFNGLGVWIASLKNAPALISSRTTPAGTSLLFESRANLTNFDSGGKAEIYRFDAEAAALECLSCDRTGGAPGTDASLIAPLVPPGDGRGILNKWSEMGNLSPDGRRAFFETDERLVNKDNDGVTDVYEWEAEGKGSCREPDGCLFLISSGQSSRANHLFGVSESGDDVFILTADLLVPQDTDDTPSVYDARVGGGFPPPVPPAGECLGEACQPSAVAPSDPTPNSSSFNGQGNVVAPPRASRCPAGKRKVRRAGKTRCVKPKKRSHKKSRTRPDRRTHR